MKPRFKPDDFVFVCDMTDIGNPSIPRDVLIDIFEKIESFKDTKFLFLTKNPFWYTVWIDRIPENVTLGATIETDLDTTIGYSLAPSSKDRLFSMKALELSYPDRPRFVSVEPIMQFSGEFPQFLATTKPWAVAVGYDNYKNNLPEPSLGQTKWLITQLEKAGITVYRKTIREPHNVD